MLKFVTGDLLQSEAYALVNAVNCEGYMGKGLAYQFKLKYPEMNDDYEHCCKLHNLSIGSLHCFKTGGKLIINLPTKVYWREKSKMEYIALGVDVLIQTIHDYGIKSIAIPPLGCGNGGLAWYEVRTLLVQKLTDISRNIDILIYEPTKDCKTLTTRRELSLSALLLMTMKFKVKPIFFNKLSLQTTAYFMNIFSQTQYFHFKKTLYGPYDSNIETICKSIKEYEKNTGVSTTEEAYDILLDKLISRNIQEKLSFYLPYIDKAADLVNSFPTNHDIVTAGLVLFIIQEKYIIDEKGILQGLKSCLGVKAEYLDAETILGIIKILENAELIERVQTPSGCKLSLKKQKY